MQQNICSHFVIDEQKCHSFTHLYKTYESLLSHKYIVCLLKLNKF